MKKAKVILVVLLSFLLVFSAIGVFGDEAGELQDQKKEVDSNIKDTQGQIDEVKEQKSATMGELETLEGQIEVLVGEIGELEAQLAQAEVDLARQQEEYDAIEAKLRASQESMSRRVCSIYMNGDISYLDIIFSSESISDFLSSFTFFEKIVQQDQGIVNGIQENKRLAQEKLDELQATKDKIQSVTDTKKNQEAVLGTQQEEKQGIMATLESQEDTLMEVLAAFEAESSKIERELQSLSSSSSVVYNGNGQFGWPLPGYSIGSGNGSKYGMRIHPVTGVRKLHTGIDIPAPSGTPIYAAEAGTVVSAGYKGAYGNCVIIDHGGGYSTLYGHMVRLGSSSGQSVSRGQVIGYVGTTGYSTGNHLHFEVRVNGSPQNPLSYT